MVKKHKKKSKQESKKRSKNTTKPKIYRKTFIIDNDIVGLYKYLKKMKLNPKHNFVDFKTNRKDNRITFIFQSKILLLNELFMFYGASIVLKIINFIIFPVI